MQFKVVVNHLQRVIVPSTRIGVTSFNLFYNHLIIRKYFKAIISHTRLEKILEWIILKDLETDIAYYATVKPSENPTSNLWLSAWIHTKLTPIRVLGDTPPVLLHYYLFVPFLSILFMDRLAEIHCSLSVLRLVLRSFLYKLNIFHISLNIRLIYKLYTSYI